MAGIPTAGILEKTGLTRLPPAIVKYLFCSPNADLQLRCLPSAGGFYDQRYRDIIEFTIIENQIKRSMKDAAR